MVRVRSALGVIAAIGLIAFLGWIAVKAVDKDPAVFGSVIAAAGAVMLAVFQRRWEKKQELERLHRDEMAPIYEDFIDRLKDLEKIKDEAEIEELFKNLTTKLLVHGSSSVIKAWIAWRQSGPQKNPEDLSMIVSYESLLRAIRVDLGHDDASLKTGELLQVYVTDLAEPLAKWQAAQLAEGTETSKDKKG
jgi:hypothetical protein